jgi:hypothetical protein
MQLSQRPSRPGARGWACNEALHSPARCLESVEIGGAHRLGQKRKTGAGEKKMDRNAKTYARSDGK